MATTAEGGSADGPLLRIERRLEHPPATGVPATGVPATGVPATGVPATGVPATGVPATGVPATLTLAYDQRQRSRQRTQLDSGEAVGLFLPRGTVLRDGDWLSTSDGRAVRVVAAAEPVTTVAIDESLALARLCYHLGNRHVPLQIAPGWVRYRRDHVLDQLVEHLGLVPVAQEAPFEPETGAYGAHHHHRHGAENPPP